MKSLYINHFLLFLIFLLLSSISLKAQVYDTIEDARDGRQYLTIKIGDKVWMAENLNYKTKRGSSCYADEWTNCSKYGRLYTWDVVNTVCPDGWHASTQHEWHKLVYFLGGPDSAAKHLKLKSELWKKQNPTDDNSSGFSALPAGKRNISNASQSIGYYAYFWTATESSDFAWCCYMSCSGKDVLFNILPRETGMSLRCVKD
jgi:uncharacterized protein (TIGR02145 family)